MCTILMKHNKISRYLIESNESDFFFFLWEFNSGPYVQFCSTINVLIVTILILALLFSSVHLIMLFQEISLNIEGDLSA